MEYNHEKAVADGVNVGYDIYRINTQITAGAARRWTPASSWTNATARPAKSAGNSSTKPLAYDAADLDRDVVAPDQIRTVLTTFRDRLFTEMFPGRTDRAQDPHLRQGRHPRRRHRPHLPRGVRQGQRLLPEDHLPHRLHPHRRKEAAGRRHRSRGNHLETRLQPVARGNPQRLPQQLLPAHRRHRGHDRHRHGHQAAGNRLLHAQRRRRRTSSSR